MSNRCKAKIRFGDDYGDNSSTFHCQLEEGHTEEHSEKGEVVVLMSEKPLQEFEIRTLRIMIDRHIRESEERYRKEQFENANVNGVDPND